MKIVNLNKNKKQVVLGKALAVLSRGGMIIYPTETAYGLGVDATNKQAVDKLFEYKSGRGKKAISIAVSDQNMARKYVSINSIAKNLYDNFLPGPVTVVSRGKHLVADKIEDERGTLGVRIPDCPFILELIRAYGKPITATSANTSGKKTPYSIEDIFKYTSNKKLKLVDLIVDADKLNYNPPSTVVDTTINELVVVRQGRIKISSGSHEKIITKSEEETQQVATQIIDRLVSKLKKSPVIVAIEGELGAGKTQLVKGLARAMGVKNLVTSPTYTLLKEYEYELMGISGKIFHIDCWRMQSNQELESLGLDKILITSNLIAIEWMNKTEEILRKYENKLAILWVKIEELDMKTRSINLSWNW